MAYKTLKLILGDQLNRDHSWFRNCDDQTLFLLAELKQETDYTKHHVQKVCAFFLAMKKFADELVKKGHKVCFLTLDESSEYKDLPTLMKSKISEHDIQRWAYQRPDEYRLSEQIKSLEQEIGLPCEQAETEHFLLPYEDIPKYFEQGKHVRMEGFYRSMRRRFQVLMEDKEPVGGKWNFDSDNRKSFAKKDLQEIPEPLVFANPIGEILKRIKAHEVSTIGNASDELVWPVDREQSLSLLNFFCNHLLPNFGRFQDAMTQESEYQWSLYHSRISFALNAKILNPKEVIDAVIAAYWNQDSAIDIAQVEGFVRQILGWREYVRGIYWVNMPTYLNQNKLNANRQLPSWFWDGETQMACMRAAVGQSLDYAYAHHIQRLMITGNFALLAGINPDEVDDWYLGIYVDAIEWVELPNTRGMALFADGGWVATKPYAASGNYVNKMSDYCKGCHYSVKKKIEDDACPLNSLYWHFIHRNMPQLENNPRMAFPVKNWNKQDAQMKEQVLGRAEYLLNNLDNL